MTNLNDISNLKLSRSKDLTKNTDVNNHHKNTEHEKKKQAETK